MGIPKYLIKATRRATKIEGETPAVLLGFGRIVETLLETGVTEETLRTIFESSLLPEKERSKYIDRKVEELLGKILKRVNKNGIR